MPRAVPLHAARFTAGRDYAFFEDRQAAQGLFGDLRALAEGEADLGAARFLVVVEDRARDGDGTPTRSGSPRQNFRTAVRSPPSGVMSVVTKYVPSGRVDLEADLAQAIAEQVPLGLQVRREVPVVVVGQVEGISGRELERAAGHEGQELLGRPDSGDQLRAWR